MNRIFLTFLIQTLINLSSARASVSQSNTTAVKTNPIEVLAKGYNFIKMNPGRFKMGTDQGDGFEVRYCVRYFPTAGSSQPWRALCPDDAHLIESAHPQHEVELTQGFEIADAPLGPEMIELFVKHKHGPYPDKTKCQNVTFEQAQLVINKLNELDSKYQ